MQGIGKILAVAALATCLPLRAAIAADAPDAPGAAGGAPAAEAQTTQDATGSAAPEADAPEAAPAPDPDAKLDAYPGIVVKMMADGMVVRRAGRPSDPRAPPVMAFVGELGVPVEGLGKNNWLALRRGDLVMVSYAAGPPHRAMQVNVLRHPAVRKVMEARPAPPGRRQRHFVGYIKRKEGDELIVMTPRAAPPSRREAEIKAFVRTPHTEVGLLRDAWDELRKGDRVRIGHQKGNPRPIDVVQVIRRAGEEPLAPGLARRLFHPDYDESVKDVDGISEAGPLPAPPLRGARKSIQLRRGVQ